MTWRPVPRADLWIAGGFVLAAAVEPWLRGEAGWALAADTAGAVTFGALAVRRTRPLLMVTALCVLALLGTAVQAFLAPSSTNDSAVGVVALLVASYSLGAYASRRQLLLGAPQPLLLIVGIDLIEPGTESLASAVPFAALFVVLVPVLAGRLLRARARLVDRLDAQAAELAAHREDQVQVALATERVRLAEELHARLLAGMEDLARQVGTLDVERQAVLTEVGDVAEVERAARELLRATRTAVVRLAAPVSTEGAVAPPPGPARPAPDLRPWTALAGAALGAGLLLELRSMSLLAGAPVAVLGCALVALPLAFAWTAPVAMTAALWGAAAGFDHLVAPLDASFTAIGLAFAPPFLVAALSSRPRAAAGLAVCVLGEATCFGVPALADHAVILVLAWVAGLVLHERGRLADRLHTSTALLCEQRDAAARRVVLEERARLARELHDALGHSLTVVVLQAEAARRLWTTEQERATALLGVIAATTQDGLESLRSGLLPGGPTGALLTPTALADLFDRARAAGITVDASIDDLADLLGPEAEVAVYRVLQEALTNVLKHAPGARAFVVVRRAGEGLELSVSSSGGHATTAAGSGRGLLGMQARVLACGGQLDWSHGPDRTFRVRASVPAAARDVVPA